MTKQAKENINYTLSTLAIEKLTPSKAAIKLCEETTAGKMSVEKAIKALTALYGVKHV